VVVVGGRVGFLWGRGGGFIDEVEDVRLRLGGEEEKEGPLDAMGIATDEPSSFSFSFSEPSSSTDWKDEVERVGLCFEGEGLRALGREGRGGGRREEEVEEVEGERSSPAARGTVDLLMGEGPAAPKPEPALEG